MMIKNSKLFCYLITFIALGGLIFPAETRAQSEPEFLISWQAGNYAPPGYLGRRLPTSKTVLETALELVENGRLLNLAQSEIRWFFDGQLQKSGTGMKTAFFVIPDFISAGSHSLEVTIVGFRGRNLEKKVGLPIAEPEVIIDAPYPQKKILAGFNTFRALPYFFNISRPVQLLFNWAVNGRKVTASDVSPDLLRLDTSAGFSGQPISLTLEALSKINQLEAASRAINLEIK